MDSLLTAKEVAQILNCHPQSIYRNKELPKTKIPGIGIRFKEKELNKYLEQRAINLPPNIPQIIHNQSFSLINPPDYDITTSKISGGIISEMPKGKSKTRHNFGYGAIYQRKMKRGKIRWYLDYYDADHRRIQKVVKNAQTKDEAALALKEEVAIAFDMEYNVKRKREKIRFKDFAELYLENYAKVKKKSWRSDYYYLTADIVPCFGDRFLSDINPLLVEQYIAKRLKDGVKKSSVNREIACLKKMFSKAIDWDYVTKNPIKKVKLFSEKDNIQERVLSVDEEEKLLNSCSERIKPIIITALQTGMRRGEILNLLWKNVFFEKKVIRVENTKSGRVRVININTKLLEVLKKLYNTRRATGGFNGEELVFPYRDITTAFKGACKRAGIENLRFHDLRHAFASRLVESGINLIVVKDLLGHCSVTVTERYSHSNENLMKEAVEALAKNYTKKAKKEGSLLHICDTKKGERKAEEINRLFSTN